MVPQPHLHPHLEHSYTALDALYCSEEHWEEEEEEYKEEKVKDFCEYHFRAEDCGCTILNSQRNSLVLLEQDLFWEKDELKSLLSREKPNELYKTLQTDPSLAAARRGAVEWMLKVNAHYSFSALTAVLAVDYLDRYLSRFHFQRDKPWMSQLAAVACLSLAAKVEETQVPLLLDLQVEDSRFLFEAKTIKKMEILVLSTLQWRMNPVTPLSFVDYITRRLGFKEYVCWELLRRCERTLLSVILDSSSMSFLPSVIATATMLHVFKTMESDIGVEHQNQLLGILGMDKDILDECCKLVSDASKGHDNHCKKRKIGSVPGSPTGVMDLSFSSDSSNDSWSVPSSVSSSPEPLSKKNRADDQLQQTRNRTMATNFLNIAR